jgi:accessory colonization factor AcfC
MNTNATQNTHSAHEVTPEEEEAWRDMERQNRDKLFTLAQQRAGEHAQEFIDNSPKAELGIFTLRKAFEMGFIRGAMATYKELNP